MSSVKLCCPGIATPVFVAVIETMVGDSKDPKTRKHLEMDDDGAAALARFAMRDARL